MSLSVLLSRLPRGLSLTLYCRSSGTMELGLDLEFRHNNKIMKFISKKWRKLIVVSYVFFTPFSLLYAACAPGTICNPLESSNIHSIPEFIRTFLTKALELGIPIVALAVIYCGFLF